MTFKYSKSTLFDVGFINLEKKVKKLIPIMKRYRYNDLVVAIFSITSWKDNRSAQESCFALNSVLLENSKFGDEVIDTYDDFIDFFKLIEPIIKISKFDDVILNDFGEIKIYANNQFFPLITGTGHTGSVFTAIQFLESITDLVNKKKEFLNILEYIKVMIDTLKPYNISKYEDIPIVLDIPTIEYFNTVKIYINNNPTSKLYSDTIKMLISNNKPITQIHFIQKNIELYPLFNPSLLLDFYSAIIEHASLEEIKQHIHKAISMKIEEIYFNKNNSQTSIFISDAKISINQKLTNLDIKTIFFGLFDSIMILIDVNELDNMQIQEYINKLNIAHKENKLGFIDLNRPMSKNGYYAINVSSKAQITIIPFNYYTNLNKSYIKFSSKDENVIYSALDLIYILMIAENIKEIEDFNKFCNLRKNIEIFSWGGLSDIYTIWKKEQGNISKGAIEYNFMSVPFEITSTYIYNLYLNDYRIFPFHLDKTPMGYPEQWVARLDKNNIFQYSRKGKNFQKGAAFLLKNGGYIYYEYDLLSIIQNQDSANIRSWHDLVSGLNERFILENHDLLKKVVVLENKMFVFKCKSLCFDLSNNNYIKSNIVLEEPNYIIIDYFVDTKKLMHDISICKNREIESNYLLDLLQPLFKKYLSSFKYIEEKIKSNSSKNKTVDIKYQELDYYINLNYSNIRLLDNALIKTRKLFALIASKSGVKPGRYSKRDATNIVRKMQEELVSYFESLICKVDRNCLHFELLYYYSAELFSKNINDNAYNLTNNIAYDVRLSNKKKIIDAREDNKQMQVALQYLIETNILLTDKRSSNIPTTEDVEELVAYSHWLVVLQTQSDICFHTSSDTHFIILDDYRVNVEIGEKYESLLEMMKFRSYENGNIELLYDQMDKEFLDKTINGFLNDTGIEFRVLISVLKHLMVSDFIENDVNYSEIKPNVIIINKQDLIKDYFNIILEDISEEMVNKVYDYLTISPSKLKTIENEKFRVLPIWERKKRIERFDTKPLLLHEENFIYSPAAIKELYSRWMDGWFQFYPPYEIGLNNTMETLHAWKRRYEKIFSELVRDYFKKQNYTFAEKDVDLFKFDKIGNHPTNLGDYDVIALDLKKKKIFVIECKVLQPVGSIFEHSMQQKGFFQQNKYDEKFQKRIDYFIKNYKLFFLNNSISISEDNFEIYNIMVVNKVFTSFYKEIKFDILTFNELKKLI